MKKLLFIMGTIVIFAASCGTPEPATTTTPVDTTTSVVTDTTRSMPDTTQQR